MKSVKVNDTEITKYITIPIVRIQNFRLIISSKRIWTYKEKVNKSGEFTYSITVYNVDGAASNPMETTLKVSN